MASPEYQFSEWLRRYHPGLFAAAKKRAQQKVKGNLGQTHPDLQTAVWQDSGILPNFVPNAPHYADAQTTPKKSNGDSWLSKLTDTVKEVLPVYIQGKTQKDILDAQLDRAKKGLPPLETSQIAPTVRVETDVGEQVERFTTGISSTLQKAMIFGGIGLGAYFLFFHGNK